MFVLCAPVACTNPPSEPSAPAAPRAGATSEVSHPAATSRATPSAAPSLAAAYPHDTTAFTEGLVFDQGSLLESTGLYGESKLRRVDLATGKVLAEVKVPREYFGEGLALLHGELFQLTYKEGRCFVYDAATLQKKRELTYGGEGWGLTTDGTLLVMSDGSPTITFRDPATLKVSRSIQVIGPSGPVKDVNELEWVRGFILANVWGSDVIIRIDPSSGRVVQTVDLAWLPEPRRHATPDDVLNGIAYDEAGARLLVTGKRWSHVFEVPLPW